ncbi:fimbrial assembly protein PilN [Pseudorhodoferax soli]|uniref:Fimbrial assembly protein PilN n=2 Tax=Pseudorhodoferax soli TaxID=545864 RepID=A0A368XW21_9BURK|nr:fimbrial assembly protein PilN [Pseudorhodoferax soli]
MAMQAPRLDFLPPSPWARWWGHGVLALGLAACALVGLRYGQAADAQAKAHARLQPQPVAERSELPRALAAEIAAAQAVAATLAVPWDAWFRALESVSVPGVFLTALQPEGNSRRARVSGQAAELAQVLDYMAKLERTPGFRQVLLVDHAVQEDAVPRQLRFTLTAEWEAP